MKSGILKAILRLTSITLALYLLLIILLYFFQRNLIYFPTPQINYPNLQTKSLPSNTLQLHGYEINPHKKHLILYFPGNAEHVEFALDSLSKTCTEATIAGFHYRGYSGSQGRPSQRALFQDATAIYDHYKQYYSSISIVGRSLGSGVAVFLSANRKTFKQVLVTPFDSLLSVAQRKFPYLPIALMLKDPYMSSAYASNVKAPTLILTAENDQLVPSEHSIRLFHSLSSTNTTYLELQNVNHNSISQHQNYLRKISTFLGAELCP